MVFIPGAFVGGGVLSRMSGTSCSHKEWHSLCFPKYKMHAVSQASINIIYMKPYFANEAANRTICFVFDGNSSFLRQ
jgi:hypothetical protein